MRKLTALLCTCISLLANAQSGELHRKVAAIRNTSRIVIDGNLGDSAWASATLLNDFVEWRPSFNKSEEPKSKTEIRLVYDDEAIFVAGYCHENGRDSVSTELIGRDKIGVNDYVGIIFDTYHDQINGFGYYVTPLGEQFDAKYASGNEDESWNSVYTTATKIVDDGWVFEMMIPYSAIRFSKEKVQTWGLNVTRKRNKAGKQYMWNPVDPNKSGFLTQFGTWEGLENIKPPIRLSFSPYFSTYARHDGNVAGGSKWSNSVNGGMDLKYGLNKAFTLDMTLIPDFGQVQSDNQVLNLTPFEVKFNENRTFFTEGTELFNKGNLFYSRRIGGEPLHYWDVDSKLKPNETIIKNPSETRLINATKVSGRTASGLGIGFFNAVTNTQYAIVSDGKDERKIETNPLTNYSVIVFDQTLKNNSSISFVNTNVMRSGKDYDANVAAFLFDIYDKNIDWNVWGKAGISQLFGYGQPGKVYNGYQYNIGLGKFKGPFNFNITQTAADRKYQQNDMGYFTNNNFIDHNSWIGYKWTKPKSFYNNLYFNVNLYYSLRFKPTSYQSFTVNTNLNGQLKNLWYAGAIVDYRAEEHDFYEPRVAGKMFRRPSSYMGGFWAETNRSKKYSAGLEYYHRYSPKYAGNSIEASINNKYRFNNKFTLSLSQFLGFYKNSSGFAFVSQYSDSIYFGLRNRHTVENIFDVKYNFTNRMGITLRARHYWSKVDYKSYFTLKQDGYLFPVGSAPQNPNNNVNYFNVDMIYTWQFAPGSFINISWKNAADDFDQQVKERYLFNLKNVLNVPQANTFSLKVIYFLDYLQLKKGMRTQQN